MSRRAMVAGTGLLAVSTAIAGCSTYGRPPAPGGAPATTPGYPPAPAGELGAGGAEPGTAESAPALGATAGEPLASAAEIPVGGGQVFAAQQVVVTQPAAADFRAFSAICTHQGCTLQDVSGGTINCACHGSQFDATDGSVVTGPAARPLQSRDVVVEDGQIRLL